MSTAALSIGAIPVAEPAPRRTVNPWLVALTVTLATFMELLDTSIANVALPHIAGGLSAGLDETTWVLTSYLVANAIVLPLSAWLSTIFGRKRFYMTCVALFTISSLLCGFAPNLESLIFFRILQGIGGGGLAPSEQAIPGRHLSRREAGLGLRGLQHRHCSRSGHRAHSWAVSSPISGFLAAGASSSTFPSAFSHSS